MSVPNTEMTLIDEEMWCETTGGFHSVDDPDPESEGPRYRDFVPGDSWEGHPSTSWEFHEDAYRGYGGELWHYTCPGPHHKVYMQEPVEVPLENGEEVKMNSSYNDRIVKLLEGGGNFTVPQIAQGLGVHGTAISSNLTALVREKRIKRVRRGLYTAAPWKATPEPRATKTQLETMRQNPSNGDLYEFLGTSKNGKLILRHLDGQTLVVAEPLEV